ncbi:MAG: hypothetical protein ACREUW_03630 [Burkholderiales bacterium]
MHKSLTTVLLVSTLALGAPIVYGQTMVQPPSRASNDYNENGGVSEGSAPGPGAQTNRQRQKEFNRTQGYDTTAYSRYRFESQPHSSADPSAPYYGSRDSSF